MAEKDSISGTENVSPQLRAETIAYAVQCALHNLIANLYEPWIGSATQRYYARKGKNPSVQYGSYLQNLGGEVAGDISGAGAMIIAEALIPERLHALTRCMRGWVDPLYTSVAHRVFDDQKDSPDYEAKVNEWKTFQERNLVRSAIMMTTGIAGNIAAQKLLLSNPSPTSVIFKGKLLSSALTTSLNLGSRFLFPERMKGVDEWLGKNVFAPMLSNTEISAGHIDPSQSHVSKLQTQPTGSSLTPVP